MKTFREQLKELIEKQEAKLGRKVTQKEIGDAIGVTQTQISEYLNSDVDPSLSSVIGLAKYFKVGLDYFTGQYAPIDNTDDVRLLNNALMKQVEELRIDKEELKKDKEELKTDKQSWKEQNRLVWEQNERIWALMKNSGPTLNAG